MKRFNTLYIFALAFDLEKLFQNHIFHNQDGSGLNVIHKSRLLIIMKAGKFFFPLMKTFTSPYLFGIKNLYRLTSTGEMGHK